MSDADRTFKVESVSDFPRPSDDGPRSPSLPTPVRPWWQSRWEALGWILFALLLIGFFPVVVYRTSRMNSNDFWQFYESARFILEYGDRAPDSPLGVERGGRRPLRELCRPASLLRRVQGRRADRHHSRLGCPRRRKRFVDSLFQLAQQGRRGIFGQEPVLRAVALGGLHRGESREVKGGKSAGTGG